MTVVFGLITVSLVMVSSMSWKMNIQKVSNGLAAAVVETREAVKLAPIWKLDLRQREDDCTEKTYPSDFRRRTVFRFSKINQISIRLSLACHYLLTVDEHAEINIVSDRTGPS